MAISRISALPTEPCIIIIFVMAIINNVYWVTKCLFSKPIIIVLFLHLICYSCNTFELFTCTQATNECSASI